MFEKIPSLEKDIREQTVNALRAVFVEGKEGGEEVAREMINKWTNVEEEKVNRGLQKGIDLNLKRAEIYFEGGI